MGKNERRCAFAVMVDTGEQPRSTIHMAAFEEADESAIGVTMKMEGRLVDQVTMVIDAVKSIGQTLAEKGNPLMQMAYYSRVNAALKEVMSTDIVGAAEALDKIRDMVGLNDDDDEEGDED